MDSASRAKAIPSVALFRYGNEMTGIVRGKGKAPLQGAYQLAQGA